MLYRAPVESMLEKFTYSKFKRLCVTLSGTYGFIHSSYFVWNKFWLDQIIWSIIRIRTDGDRGPSYGQRIAKLIEKPRFLFWSFWSIFEARRFLTKLFLDRSWSNKFQVFPFLLSTINLDMGYPFEWIGSKKSCQHHKINNVPKVVNEITFLVRLKVSDLTGYYFWSFSVAF